MNSYPNTSQYHPILGLLDVGVRSIRNIMHPQVAPGDLTGILVFMPLSGVQGKTTKSIAGVALGLDFGLEQRSSRLVY